MGWQKLKRATVLQQDHFDCGVACLATLINYYKGVPKLEQIRQWSGTTKQGTTLLGLYQAAQNCGFEAYGYEADLASLKTHQIPVVLHVRLESNWNITWFAGVFPARKF